MAKSKYNVDKDASLRTFNGVVYDSVKEMEYYRDFIVPRMSRGEILSCEKQVPFVLQQKFQRVDSHGKSMSIREIKYVADYVVTYSDGHTQVIDTKGFADAVALMKRKMFWCIYPNIDYRWISYSKIDGGWIEYDELKKRRASRKKKKQDLLH